MSSFPVHRARSRRSFTLVEMLVAIGIIVILAVITVSAAVALVERSEVRATESTLTLLDTAVHEWQAESDRKITWGRRDQPLPGAIYNMYDGTPHVFTLSEVLRRIRRTESVKSILAQIKPESFYTFDSEANPDAPGWIRLRQQGDPDPNFKSADSTYSSGDFNGQLAVFDAWGTPIRAVHPGRVFDKVLFAEDFGQDNLVDEDGTIPLTSNYGADGTYGVEEYYGTARDRRILFVSAGPDGQFGSLGADEDSDMHQWTHDNVYSYSVEDVHDDE